MPKVDNTPRVLKPYAAHGVLLSEPDARGNCRGDCPFCGREGKLSVSSETGSAHCWACTINPEAPKGGVNLTTFLRRLWEESVRHTAAEDVEALRADRGYAGADVLQLWGAARSLTTGEWLLPGYDANLRVCQLYRWADLGKGRALLATPKAGELPGGGFFCNPEAWSDPDAGEVHVCEGPWDGMALEEALVRHKAGDDPRLPVRTSDPSGSLLVGRRVMAVPGCGAVGELLRAWLPVFRGKDVFLWFDDDDAGGAAAQRAAAMVAEVARSVRAPRWGEVLRDGWKDVRDVLTRGVV